MQIVGFYKIEEESDNSIFGILEFRNWGFKLAVLRSISRYPVYIIWRGRGSENRLPVLVHCTCLPKI